MSIVSGIRFASNLSKHGKLIGTAKNSGIKVFEQIGVDGSKTLTSVGKDDKVLKLVVKEKGGDVTVRNYVNGEKVVISPGTMFTVVRQPKNGLKEYYCRQSGMTSLVLGEGKNSLTLESRRSTYNGIPIFTMSNANKFDLNGLSIPAGYTKANICTDGHLGGMGGFSFDKPTHEKNLMQTIYDAFAKILG